MKNDHFNVFMESLICKLFLSLLDFFFKVAIERYMSHLVKKSGRNFSLACDHAASLRLLAGLPFSCFVFLCHHAFMFRANQPSPGNTPLYILQQQQQHPPTSTFFKTPFAATLVRNLRHTYFFHHMHLVLTRNMQL